MKVVHVAPFCQNIQPWYKYVLHKSRGVSAKRFYLLYSIALKTLSQSPFKM